MEEMLFLLQQHGFLCGTQTMALPLIIVYFQIPLFIQNNTPRLAGCARILEVCIWVPIQIIRFNPTDLRRLITRLTCYIEC
jgi:hypothetical protein